MLCRREFLLLYRKTGVANILGINKHDFDSMALLFYHFSLGLMVHYSFLPATFPSHCLGCLVGSYMSLKAHW